MIELRHVGLLLILVATSHGQGLVHLERNMPAGQNSFGHAVAIVGDLNFDGFEDYAIGAPYAVGVTGPDQGRVTVYSGFDQSMLFQWSGANGEVLGSDVAGVGDIDGDTVPDIAVGSLGFGPNGEGAVEVRSGLTGNLIWRFVGTYPGEGLGDGVAPAGDVDVDGVPDVIASTSLLVLQATSGPAGRAVVISGSTGAPIYDKYGSGNMLQAFGFDAANVGDVNGDGVPDMAVSAPGTIWSLGFGQGAVYLYSGFGGGYIGSLTAGPGSRFGQSVASIEDLDGDGVREILVGEPEGANIPSGSVHVFSGATRTLLITVTGPGQLGHSVAAADCDGDGVEDIIAGWIDTTGQGVRVFSGASFLELSNYTSTYTLPPGATSSSVIGTTALAAGGDITGDGITDYVFGQGPLGNATEGRVDIGSTCGARSYGTPGGGTLQLDFLATTNGAAPGAVVLSGGPPGGQAFLFVSLDSGSSTYLGLPVWISTTGLATIPVVLDASGAFTGLLDLRDPSLAGVTLFGQGLAFGPNQSSNGLEVRFCQ